MPSYFPKVYQFTFSPAEYEHVHCSSISYTVVCVTLLESGSFGMVLHGFNYLVTANQGRSAGFESGKRDDGESLLLGGDELSGCALDLKVKGHLVIAFPVASSDSEKV